MKKIYIKPEASVILFDTEDTVMLTGTQIEGAEQDLAKGDHGGGHFTWGNLWADEDFAEDEDLD